MESQHMTQQTFAELIGISPGSLSSIFSERTKPTLNIVDAIMSKFTNLSLEWLMYGRGAMFKDGTDQHEPAPSSLFSSTEDDMQNTSVVFPSLSIPPSGEVRSGNSSSAVRKPQYIDAKYFDKPQRNITEIRIFFDDQTWETFVPKK